MSAGNDARVNQYPVLLDAGEELYNVTPSFLNSPSKRVLFKIQNTGSAPVKYRWNSKVQDDGGDFTLAPGEKDTFADPCPQGRISISAPGAATTVAIIECIVQRSQRTSGVVG
jgi:hypothetical protein